MSEIDEIRKRLAEIERLIRQKPFQSSQIPRPYTIPVSDVDGTINDWLGAHADRHQYGGSDQVGTLTPAAYAIPMANASGNLDDWVTVGTGVGDMLKSTYDTNNDGIVENADKLDGQHGSYYANQNAYSSITDGTNSASAGITTDTFKIRSANSILSVLVTDNDPTHGDNILFTINQGNIDHGSISGLTDDDHAQYASAEGSGTRRAYEAGRLNLSITAGSGLTGGGLLTSSQTLAIDFTRNNTWTGVQTFSAAISAQNGINVGTATGATGGNIKASGTISIDGTSNSYIMGKLGLNQSSPGAWLDIVPSSTSDIVLRTKSIQSTAPLGSELITNGNFSTHPDTAWTWGTGWTHDTANGEADHASGNTAALSQNISVTNGATYLIVFTIKNYSAGNITVDINGVYAIDSGTNTAFSYNQTIYRTIVANTTGSVAFRITPSSTFVGSVDDISVKQITGTAQPNITLLDDAGNTTVQIVGKASISSIGFGANALRYLTTGASYTTAFGYGALQSNTTGYFNTAVGAYSLQANTTGYFNTAIGSRALYGNTTGEYNTAVGTYSLYSNTTGVRNTAVGTYSLYSNTTGYNNAAVGMQSLYSNTTGVYNTAVGTESLYSNTTGYLNVAIGYIAGRYISGGGANQTSNNSVYLGYDTRAYASGDTNEIVIGASTTGFGSNTAAYGNSSITKHIFQAGNVGIGTSTPGYKLHVAGGMYADELTVKAFIADLEQALAGGQIVAKSVAVVSANFTLPSAGSSVNFYVKDLPSAPDMAVFQNGDWVGFRQMSRSGGALTVAWAWGTVSGYVDQSDGTQRWTFTRDTTTPGSASGTIYTDSLVLDYGTSGNGYYEVNAIDGTYGVNSPYAQIVTWNTHPATTTIRTRLGNMYGLFGVSGEYGMFAGDGVAGTNKYLRITSNTIEAHNVPINMYDGGAKTIALDPTAPSFAMGATLPTGYATNTGIWFGKDSGTYKFRIGEPSGDMLAYDGSVIKVQADSNNYITTSGTSIEFYSGGTKVIDIANTPSITIGNVLYNNILITNSSLKLRNATTDIISFDATGDNSILNKLLMSGSSAAISIGTTPPTSSSSGTGIWIDRTGLYSLSGGTKQVWIDAIDGKLYFSDNTAYINQYGIIFTPADAFNGKQGLYWNTSTKIDAYRTSDGGYSGLEVVSNGTLESIISILSLSGTSGMVSIPYGLYDYSRLYLISQYSSSEYTIAYLTQNRISLNISSSISCYIDTSSISGRILTTGNIYSGGGTSNLLTNSHVGSVVAAHNHTHKFDLSVIIGDGVNTITTGSKGYLRVPRAATVTGWNIVADASGSIVVDVKRCTYSGFPTTSSIAGSEKPTLSSAQKNEDTSLTTWTTILSEGDWLEFYVDSASTVKQVTVALQCTG